MHLKETLHNRLNSCCLYWPDTHLHYNVAVYICRHLVSTFMMSTFYDHVTSRILTARGFFATLMFD